MSLSRVRMQIFKVMSPHHNRKTQPTCSTRPQANVVPFLLQSFCVIQSRPGRVFQIGNVLLTLWPTVRYLPDPRVTVFIQFLSRGKLERYRYLYVITNAELGTSVTCCPFCSGYWQGCFYAQCSERLNNWRFQSEYHDEQHNAVMEEVK